MAELSDAQVFGSTSAPPAATKEMSDEDVYGLTGYVEPGTNTTGVDPDVDPRVADAVSSVVKRLVAPSPTGEDNPALASGDPRDSLPPAPVVAPIEKAMGEGWQATPSILTPETQAYQDQFLWGKYFVNPLFRVANAIPAATNALMYGGAELANQVTGDPRAGRDALTLMQLWPMGRNGVITAPGDVPPPSLPGPRARQSVDGRVHSARRPCVPTNRRDHRSQIRRLAASRAPRPRLASGRTSRLRPGRQRTRRLPACRPVQLYQRICGCAPPSTRLAHRPLNRRPASCLQARCLPSIACLQAPPGPPRCPTRPSLPREGSGTR